MRRALIVLSVLAAGSAAAQTPPVKRAVQQQVLVQEKTLVLPPAGILGAWNRPADNSPEPAGIDGEIRMVDPASNAHHMVWQYYKDGAVPLYPDPVVGFRFKNKRTGVVFDGVQCSSSQCNIRTIGGRPSNRVAGVDPTGPLPTGVSYAIPFRLDTGWTREPSLDTGSVRYNPNEWRFEAIYLRELRGSVSCSITQQNPDPCVSKTLSNTPWTALPH